MKRNKQLFIYLFITKLCIMKKTLFLLAAAAACTACSMDETTEVVAEGLPIDFRTAVVTRATETTISNLTQFNAVAFYTDGGLFFKQETEEIKESNTATTEHYWPTNDKELTFYAWAPVAIDLDSEPDPAVDASTITYTPEETITDQDDLITVAATGTKEENENTGVELSFKHALSQIEVQADYDGDKYTINVQGVKIANVYGTGTYTFGLENLGVEPEYGSWTDRSGMTDYDETYSSSVSLTKEAGAQSIMGEGNGTWMLIPQTLTGWNIEEDASNSDKGTYLAAYIQIKQGSEPIYPITETPDSYAWAAVPLSGTWDPNTKYTYTLHFTDGSVGTIPPGDPEEGEDILGQPIKFTVEVHPWTVEGDTSVDM